MKVENNTEKEVVYSAADGGRDLDLKFRLRILFWLWALFLRLRVALSSASNLRHWCLGKSCWGMFFEKEDPHELGETNEWGSCHIRVMVLKWWPETLRDHFAELPEKVEVVYEDGVYKLKDEY